MQDDFRSFRPVKPAATLKPTPEQNPKPEPGVPFITPEQAQLSDPVTLVPPPEDQEPTSWLDRLKSKLKWPPSRKQIIIAVAILIVVGGGGGFILASRSSDAPVATATKTSKPAPAPKPTTVPSALSGLPVAPEINQRPVVGVMIENSQAARPQAGLSEAGVVFEAIAEGGITRLLALFQDQQPGNVGPIRSARPYYVQWNEGFRAAYSHMGGSQDALVNIKAWGVQALGSSATRRVSERASPHNVYANVAELASVASSKGFVSQFTPIARKTASPAKQPNATAVGLNISSSLYNVNYAYDAASNSYKRTLAGAPHTDANNNQQLSPKVVVALIVPLSAGSKTAQGGAYSVYNVLGSGPAVIFQDGVATNVTWHKADNRAQISFTDASGAAVALNPGQTWFTAVSGANKVTYQ